MNGERATSLTHRCSKSEMRTVGAVSDDHGVSVFVLQGMRRIKVRFGIIDADFWELLALPYFVFCGNSTISA